MSNPSILIPLEVTVPEANRSGFQDLMAELVDSCTGIVSDNATPCIKGVLEGTSPLYIAQKGGFNRL